MLLKILVDQSRISQMTPEFQPFRFQNTAPPLTMSPFQMTDSENPEGVSTTDTSRSAAIPHSQNLLLLVCQFSPHGVPFELIHRGFACQSRWDHAGNRIKISPQETGLSSELAYFEDSRNLSRILESLIDSNKLMLDQHRKIHPTATVEEEVIPNLPLLTQNYWWKQASALLCHAFPRGQTLDPEYVSYIIKPTLGNSQDRYSAIGQCLAPLLKHICQKIAHCHDNMDLAATLLSARPLAPMTRFEIDTYVRFLLQSTTFNHLHIWAARSTFRKKDHRSNQEVGQLFQDTVQQAGCFSRTDNVRINAQIGRLRAVYAAHLCHYTSLDRAAEVLSSWKPSNARPSELERTVQDRIDLIKAKILRYRGENDEAHHQFELLNEKSTVKEDAFHADVLLNLLELTSDLTYVKKLPSSVFGPVEKDLHTILNRADTHFNRQDFAKALADYQSAAKNARTATQHVRAMIGIAKTNHRSGQDSAEQDWLEAEKLVSKPDWSEGFTSGLINLSLGVLIDDPQRIERGTRILKSKEHAIWLVDGLAWIKWICGKTLDTRFC